MTLRALAYLCFMVLASLLAPGMAYGQCQAEIASATIPAAVYDPFSGAVTVSAVLRVAQTGNDCQPGLTITGGGTSPARTASLGNASLAYSIASGSGTAILNTSSSAYALALPNNGQAVDVPLIFTVAASQVVGTGTYTDNLTFRLVNLAANLAPMSASGGRSTVLATNFQISVAGKAQVNIAGSSGNFGTFAITTLDFGELVQGASRQAYVQVRATSPVLITVSSANLGVLKRLGTSYQASVAYDLSLAGTALALGSGSATLAVDPPRTIDGTSLPLALRLSGSVAGLPAGTYQDVLTVDVVPN